VLSVSLLRNVSRSRITSLLLVFLLVGFSHQLYTYVSLRGVEQVFSSAQVDAELVVERRSPSQAEQVTVGFTVGDRVCSGIPVKNTPVVITAAHCLVDSEGTIARPEEVTLRSSTDHGLMVGVRALGVHPRYVDSLLDDRNPLVDVVVSAFTWGSLRGVDPQRSVYHWDAGFLVVDGFDWSFGVDALGDDLGDDPLSVYANQNFRWSGEPHCSLKDTDRCPSWSSPGEPGEPMHYQQVRCDVRSVLPGYDVDVEVLCGFFPGASGGGLVRHVEDRLLLVGILVSGDTWGAVNGVTMHPLDEVFREALAVAGP
jgi:hypothetical protein